MVARPLGRLKRALTVLSWVAAVFLGTMMGWLPGGLAVLLTLIGLRLFLRSRLFPRLRYSIRWKFLAAIALMAALFFSVSIVNFAAMFYMHESVHGILDLAPSQPQQVLPALQALDETQHGLLFSLTPVLGLVASLVALGLGLAMAGSVVDPVRRMSEAMRRMAAGDFSQPVQVDNNDEVGELARRLNQTAQELATLEAARLAEERARALHERITQVTLAQEEERRRIARELHDGLGPSLAAIGNRLRACRSLVRRDPERAERELDDVTQSLKEHVGEIRELIYDLRPLALDQVGLAEAVRQYVERFAQDAGVTVSVQAAGELALDPLGEVTVFRVVQECLSNIQKHAQATHVDLRLERSNGSVTLTVSDDGRGFDDEAPAPAAPGTGLGLLSMRERAELVGGDLTIQSAPGEGCRVVLRLPAATSGAPAPAAPR